MDHLLQLGGGGAIKCFERRIGEFCRNFDHLHEGGSSPDSLLFSHMPTSLPIHRFIQHVLRMYREMFYKIGKSRFST